MTFSETLYTYSPIILTFFLLSRPPAVTAENVEATCHAPSTAAEDASCPSPSELILDACNGTARLADLEQTCIQALISDHRTAAAVTAVELAKGVVAVAVDKADKTRKVIGSPTKPVFKSCAESYSDLVDALKKAKRWLEKDDVDEADVELGTARDAADYCSLLLTVDKNDKESPVFVANKEVFDHIIFAMSAADLL